MSVAFGQKGRCEMKLFRTPMLIASLLGFGILASVDAPPAHADFVFGEPIKFAPGLSRDDGIDCLSYDGLEMYFDSNRSGGEGDWDIWVMRRASIDADWGLPENLGSAINSPKEDNWASISADGLTLYFISNRPGGFGNFDIYTTTRTAKDADWGPAGNLGPEINSSAGDSSVWISPDGLELYFESWRSGGCGSGDIYVARRATVDDTWGEPENLGPLVNSPYTEVWPTLSPDGLLLFFSDTTLALRPGGYGGGDMWMARRANLSEPWQAAVNLGANLNTPLFDGAARISSDGRTLYFAREHTGSWEAWQAAIIPIVDFTGDGHVDGKDLLVMVMELGGSDSLCDIGPYAWGDGVVDAKDLKVLAEYIGQGFQDPTLVAHWAFDETEGDIATDSMDESDGRVMIGATWRPHAGMVGGALELDGVTGSVVTDSVAELATGPFSVIAWVKGGAPGQILLNHGGTTDWLMANPIDGSLMTKLTSPTQPLAIGTSEAVITDGKWHRIALVWDGVDRILYMDGKEVARDPQPDITVSDGKFIIGAGSTTGTGWAGLIDDVRIYSRVVRP
jgi:hypothetical protein